MSDVEPFEGATISNGPHQGGEPATRALLVVALWGVFFIGMVLGGLLVGMFA